MKRDKKTNNTIYDYQL